MAEEIRFEPCEWASLTTMSSWLADLHGSHDSYVQKTLLKSSLSRIVESREDGNIEIGFFAHVEGWLTAFYVQKTFARGAKEIFQRIVEDHSVVGALVATCDEFFLSH